MKIYKNKKLIVYTISITLLALILGLVTLLLTKNASDQKTKIDSLEKTLQQFSPTTGLTITTHPTASTTETSADKETTVKVYFSKTPDSENDFDLAFDVDRSTDRSDISTFAIEQLIAGPTTQEQSKKYYTPLELSGDSNCSQKDFLLNLKDTVAALKFCRDIKSAGIGTDARITSTITKTLKQFPAIKEIKILTKDSHCFGDQSGMDKCLN